jgi:gamma-glutamylcyclotransferase
MKYFAYGSNLNLADLKKWCDKRNENMPKLKNPKITKLENFELGFTRNSFGRKGGVADIIFSKGNFCYGVVFDVAEHDFKILDKKEGVHEDGMGAYERLELENGSITYKVRVKDDNFIQPSNEYLDVIITGAKNHELPDDWIEKLESFRRA